MIAIIRVAAPPCLPHARVGQKDSVNSASIVVVQKQLLQQLFLSLLLRTRPECTYPHHSARTPVVLVRHMRALIVMRSRLRSLARSGFRTQLAHAVVHRRSWRHSDIHVKSRLESTMPLHGGDVACSSQAETGYEVASPAMQRHPF